MKKVYPFLAAAFFVGGMSTAAIADDTVKESSGSTAGVSGSAHHSGAGAGAWMGQHTMTGTIDDIDTEKGSLTLKTDDKKLDLHFPPSAIKNLKEGDKVSVSLAIAASTGGTAMESKSSTSAGSEGVGAEAKGSVGMGTKDTGVEAKAGAGVGTTDTGVKAEGGMGMGTKNTGVEAKTGVEAGTTGVEAKGSVGTEDKEKK